MDHRLRGSGCCDERVQFYAGANAAAHARGNTDAVVHLRTSNDYTGTRHRNAAPDRDAIAADPTANADSADPCAGDEAAADQSAGRGRTNCDDRASMFAWYSPISILSWRR